MPLLDEIVDLGLVLWPFSRGHLGRFLIDCGMVLGILDALVSALVLLCLALSLDVRFTVLVQLHVHCMDLVHVTRTERDLASLGIELSNQTARVAG